MVFKLVKIDYMYCDYLRKYDKRVVYKKFTRQMESIPLLKWYVDRATRRIAMVVAGVW